MEPFETTSSAVDAEVANITKKNEIDITIHEVVTEYQGALSQIQEVNNYPHIFIRLRDEENMAQAEKIINSIGLQFDPEFLNYMKW